uniref:ribosomal protein S14 n=1 Tax=Haramonas pauciplastida TaxID=478668 RepID=UPI0021157A75|nr:ribosomal protein S14 [Haramonas pauciplastida]UTE94990.1 ribosomal protein S14 [Haramonas pauciplastida]
MAKKSSLEREKKRKKLVYKYAIKKLNLLEKFKKSNSYSEKLEIQKRIQKIPRNAAKIRLHNRCWCTGRPRGFYRDFGLSRNMIRQMGLEGFLPGLTKSSW